MRGTNARTVPSVTFPAEDDHGAATDADQEHGDVARAVEDLVVEAEHAHGLVDEADLGEVGAQVVAAGGGFALKGLDFADAGDVFLDGGADDRLLLAHVVVDGAQMLAHALDGRIDDGDGISVNRNRPGLMPIMISGTVIRCVEA